MALLKHTAWRNPVNLGFQLTLTKCIREERIFVLTSIYLTKLEISVLSTDLQNTRKSECWIPVLQPLRGASQSPSATPFYHSYTASPHSFFLPFRSWSRRAHQRCQTVRLIKFMNTAYKMQTFPSIWANIGTGNFLSNGNSRELK